MSSETQPTGPDTTGMLPIAAGAVLLVAGAWAFAAHARPDITLALGAGLVLYGIGRRRESRPLLIAAWIIPAACVLAALVGLAAWPGAAMTLPWRAVSAVAAIGLATGIVMFARANRRDTEDTPGGSVGS